MRPHGFTLLEMIVVLAILGLATALVAPSALRGIDSWRRATELDSLLDQIRALPGDARASGKPIVIDATTLASATPPLRVGDDWTIRAPEAWRVNSNGVCEGGELHVGNQYGERVVQVAAPFCDPAVVP